MNGFCTYTVEAKVEGEERPRDVLCSKPRVGQAEGPGFHLVLCRRHWDKVTRHALAVPALGVLMVLDEREQPSGDPLDVSGWRQ